LLGERASRGGKTEGQDGDDVKKKKKKKSRNFKIGGCAQNAGALKFSQNQLKNGVSDPQKLLKKGEEAAKNDEEMVSSFCF